MASPRGFPDGAQRIAQSAWRSRKLDIGINSLHLEVDSTEAHKNKNGRPLARPAVFIPGVGDSLALAEQLLRTGEKNWLALEDEDLLFDEPRNDGSWLRPWRQALVKFRKSYS